MVNGLNHITFSVSNLEQTVAFYKQVFLIDPVVYGQKTAYFDINGMWLALNVQDQIPRNDVYHTYTHLAFSINKEEIDAFLERLHLSGAEIVEGRTRDILSEGQSLYFRDPDGHLLEVHTGSLAERLEHYKKNAPEMLVNKEE
ncbi:metallothiol transferase FosB [Bacillus sp. JCM 19041]|uniref:metallothiol transferase FosB n=1 Tax=Bacillus sp. JCM 19041 TaxID=1460637 RepID=UPI0006D1BAFF